MDILPLDAEEWDEVAFAYVESIASLRGEKVDKFLSRLKLMSEGGER